MVKVVGMAIGVLLLVGATLISTNKVENPLAGGDGFSAFDCTISTNSSTSVGDDIATTVLSAHSRRAWAKVQLLGTDSNTASISLGGTAVAGTGLNIASSSPKEVVFGLNTDLPFTGAVSVITDISTTTVKVTECRYDR